jgi:UDP-N-acetylmuramyl pentapeptide synthase
VRAAQRAGLSPERALVVETPEQAVAALDPLLSSRARVLVKGSRGMRLERVVEQIKERA